MRIYASIFGANDQTLSARSHHCHAKASALGLFPLQRSSLLALTQGLLFWTPWPIVALWQVAASNSHLHDPYAALHQLDAYSMISKLSGLTTTCTRIMWARNGNDTDALRRTSSYGRSNSTWAWTVEQWLGSKTKGGFLDLHSVVFHPTIDIYCIPVLPKLM